MIFAIVFAVLYLAGLAISGIDPLVGQNAFALGQAGLGLCVLAFPSSRRAMLDALGAFWPAMLVFAAVVGITGWQAGLFGAASTAFNAFAARGEVWNLTALFFGMAGVTALAGVVGRRPLHNALLMATILFAVLDAGAKMQNGLDRPFLASAGETAAVYALMAVLAAFVWYDEARSHTIIGDQTHLGKKLLLPTAAFLAALFGLALTRSPLIAGALAGGLSAACFSFAARDFPRPLGFILAGLGAAFLAGAAAVVMTLGVKDDPLGLHGFDDSIATGLKGASGLGAGIDGGVLQTWPVEAGLWGAGAMALCVALILLRLVLTHDRRYTPSRGFGLALAATAAIAFAGPGGTGAAATATFAVLLGLACAYSDRLRTGTIRRRREAETEFDRAGSGAAMPAEA